MAPTNVLFTPLQSQPSPSFWHSLSSLKLDTLKLSSPVLSVSASYGTGRTITDRTDGRTVAINSALMLDGASLNDKDYNVPNGFAKVIGRFQNFNTVEEFKAVDKSQLMKDVADQMWKSLSDSQQDPSSILSSFLLITYSDLKKYRFWYWFAFPAFESAIPWTMDTEWVPVEREFSDDLMRSIHKQYLQLDASTRPYFLVKLDGSISPLSTYNTFFSDVPENQRTIAFLDTSASPTSPGWPLRNLLAYISTFTSHKSSTIRVLCFRDLDLPTSASKGRLNSIFGVVTRPAMTADQLSLRPNARGWEKSPTGKTAPRMADLGSMMDPERLASQSTDLNLKLMRWRLLPELDLDRVRDLKVLVCGAGTLGCYFSRGIMAWGTRHITLLDSSTVSFSNPVRQPLFEFSDAVASAPKAATAAASLKRIFPGVNATGVQLSIPMPGHPIPPASLQKVLQDIEQLEKLVDEHDAIILGMDSRESRWLPSMLGKAKGKIVMNCALGFDTYLVMRHGARNQPGKENPQLGCYFCNDVVAPSDSLRDQTLDQMCTVTRPGLAAIAAASTVELLVALIQHPAGIFAPAPEILPNSAIPEASTSASPLGLVPHQLRGYLAQFRTLPVVGAAYDRCTACSEHVVTEYEKSGADMILKVCNETGYLEELTGLDEMYKEAEEMTKQMEAWDGDDF